MSNQCEHGLIALQTDKHGFEWDWDLDHDFFAEESGADHLDLNNSREDSASTSLSPAQPWEVGIEEILQVKSCAASQAVKREQNTSSASSTSDEREISDRTAKIESGRPPKWKRRNQQKHLDGERSRRAKRKDKIATLTALLPELRGKKNTLNELLEATVLRARATVSAAEPGRQSLHRAVMLGSSRMGCFVLDERERVVEASSSLLWWLGWPGERGVVGRHVSALMVAGDAFRLSFAIAEERRFRCVEGAVRPNHMAMAGAVRFLRFEEDAQCVASAVEIEVGVDLRTSVCHFMLPHHHPQAAP